jgi:hypothetical protein
MLCLLLLDINLGNEKEIVKWNIVWYRISSYALNGLSVWYDPRIGILDFFGSDV